MLLCSSIGTVSGLAPGFHGFHIHEVGEHANACAAAAGPHFNPTYDPSVLDPSQRRAHGSPISFTRHAGDLGNIFANLRGVAKVLIKDHKISLVRTDQTFIGNRAIVIHTLKDDLGLGFNAESLVTGNAGTRDGCGVINVI
ncbi:LOW QUALITY PROTEIN: uncharacterized protein [Palaemon carinicauda]|uniref:LOW QUALITY PROTEIN: uncharacterized protein n=1 Tax=Palaemon carinicauda TaxID=392227 RepID=UPI0035B60280